jgi:hypothetical protein
LGVVVRLAVSGQTFAVTAAGPATKAARRAAAVPTMLLMAHGRGRRTTKARVILCDV